MKILLISDIHSNIYALDEVLKRESYDKILCCGDIVGYYTKPNEVIDIVKKYNIISIKGNHDYAAVKSSALENFNSVARESLVWTSNQLTDENKNFLKSLPYVIKEDNYTLVHGTLKCPQDFNYYYLYQIGEDINNCDTQLLISGHSHVVAFVTATWDEHIKWYRVKSTPFNYDTKYYLNDINKYYINCGSISQPRNRTTGGQYIVYDTEGKYIEFKKFKYSINELREEIKEAGLPRINYERLLYGR